MTPGEGLKVELHAHAWPDRVAKIEVTSGGEVYFLRFAGQMVGPDFGYDDDEKVEALKEVIKTAVALTVGPTRIKRTMADGVVLTSRLKIDPDGPNRQSLGVRLDHPVAYIKARLLRRRVTREVIDLPVAEGPHLRVTGGEAHGSRVLLDPVQPDGGGVPDQRAEDSAPRGKGADAGDGRRIHPGVDELIEHSVTSDDAEGGVPRRGDLPGGVDDAAQHRGERQLGDDGL
jgi:hypothetical protein